MYWVFLSIIFLSVAQLFLCGLSWPLFLSLVGRALFLLRLGGTIVPYKVSKGFEAANLFFVCLGIIFSKSGDWSMLFAMALCSATTCLFYFIDERYFLYVVVDEDEKEEE